MNEKEKMRKVIRKTFEAMQGQTGEMKSDFEKYHRLVHAVISNLGEFRDKPEPDIVPAEPLTDVSESMGKYYCATNTDGPGYYHWDNDSIDHFRLQDKNVFPYTPQGKAGAELRAKVPHPGIHWQEDLMKLGEWFDSMYHWDGPDVGMSLHDFLDKYLTE